MKERKDKAWGLRVPTEEWKRWAQAAAALGKSRNGWICEVMGRAAKRALKKARQEPPETPGEAPPVQVDQDTLPCPHARCGRCEHYGTLGVCALTQRSTRAGDSCGGFRDLDGRCDSCDSLGKGGCPLPVPEPKVGEPEAPPGKPADEVPEVTADEIPEPQGIIEPPDTPNPRPEGARCDACCHWSPAPSGRTGFCPELEELTSAAYGCGEYSKGGG